MTSPEPTVDWSGIYGQEFARPDGPAGWSIGEPQPALVDLIQRGQFHDEVLDAGCGLAEISLHLGSHGYTVVGIDLIASAVAAARTAATDRGLTTATFAQADVTALSGYDQRFSTIVDSSLFHALPVERRDPYLQSIQGAAAPGASLFILCFAAGAFSLSPGPGPNPVTRDELLEVVARHWVVDSVESAWIHAHVPKDGPMTGNFEDDDKGRSKIAAWLLTAHKAG